ncbi:hypothetical protein [Bradyrhizobium sp. LHD-71]|uniref:hypothetical protein n=1 Tax=Bradyrhizobium sp. LHD-71 TaxID=3072141 RepID=UPI00280E3E16|nr:hypothetical protein [Bradyrhizobium sp. LHD-71]MDQ8729499.1 hypothetical protein [Bradyrhizobium sp. LHD-71]
MKAVTVSLAVLAIVITFGGANAQSSGLDQQDRSADTLCWDTLQNIAREKFPGKGTLGASGDPQGRTTGSSAGDDVQGAGGGAKDSNRVTSGVTSEGRMTSGGPVRPAGIPDC